MNIHCLTFLAATLTLAAPVNADQRTWKDASGSFTVSAELVKVSGTSVELCKADGSVISVPLNRLCAADQAYIKKQALPTGTAVSSSTPAAAQRKWRDKSGEFSVEATLVDMTDTDVQLRKADGSVITISQEKLSTENRMYLKQRKKTGGTVGELAGVDQAMRKPTTVDFHDTPLTEAVGQLAAQHNICMQVDRRALRSVGLTSSMPITFQANAQPFETVLHDMLAPLKLGYYPIRNDALVVTSEKDESCNLLTRVYVFSSLKLSRQFGRTGPDFHTPMSQIKKQVNPDSWHLRSASGRSGSGHMEVIRYPVPCVTVSNTYRVHREIATNFSHILRPVNLALKAPPPELNLPEVLWKPCSFSVEQMSLSDFATYLRNTFALPTVIDSQALQDVGLSADVTVSGSFTEIRLITAVELLIARYDLGWFISKDGALAITTHKESCKRMITIEYRVGQIIGPPNAPPDFQDFSSLINALEGCVMFDSWNAHAAYASMRPEIGRDRLSVEHSFQGHLVVSAYLSQLRAARK